MTLLSLLLLLLLFVVVVVAGATAVVTVVVGARQLLGICYLFQFHVRLVTNGRTNVEHVFEYWRNEETNYDQARLS